MNLYLGRLISAASVALAAQCSQPPPVTDAGDAGGRVVELGTGQSDFEDIPASGGRVELIYGAQGGFHIWGRARFRGFSPDIHVRFRATRVEDNRELHMTYPARRYIADGLRRGLLDLGRGEYATDAELVVVDILCARDVVGKQVRIETTVEQLNNGQPTGVTATDSRVVTVVDEVSPQDCAMPRG